MVDDAETQGNFARPRNKVAESFPRCYLNGRPPRPASRPYRTAVPQHRTRLQVDAV